MNVSFTDVSFTDFSHRPSHLQIVVSSARAGLAERKKIGAATQPVRARQAVLFPKLPRLPFHSRLAVKDQKGEGLATLNKKKRTVNDEEKRDLTQSFAVTTAHVPG